VRRDVLGQLVTRMVTGTGIRRGLVDRLWLRLHRLGILLRTGMAFRPPRQDDQQDDDDGGEYLLSSYLLSRVERALRAGERAKFSRTAVRMAIPPSSALSQRTRGPMGPTTAALGRRP
jgi:hypothetical protein